MPKSQCGKERAAQNAFKHGLSIPAGMLPEFAPAVEAYAAQIAGHEAAAEIRTAAIAFAEAQVDIDRVRRARQLLYWDPNRRRMRPTIHEAQEATKQKIRYIESFYRVDNNLGMVVFVPFSKEEFHERVAALTLDPKPLGLEESLGALAPHLTKLWRYERRALSRRNWAERRLRLLWGARDEGARS